MKTPKSFLYVVFVPVLGAVVLGLHLHAKAQKREEIVAYLSQRFQARNLPVTSIEILEVSPLRLQIVVQSVGDYITPEDSKNLHKVDREVFVVARQNGYDVKRYVRILQNSQGKQLYKLEQGATELQAALANSSGASDNDVRNLLRTQIDLMIKDYQIENTKVAVDVSGLDGVQSVDIEFTAPSIAEAYRVFGFLHDKLIYPLDPIIVKVNTQGGQIFVATYEIRDKKDTLLFFYYYDYQLQTGTWSSAENFQVDFGRGPAPAQ